MELVYDLSKNVLYENLEEELVSKGYNLDKLNNVAPPTVSAAGGSKSNGGSSDENNKGKNTIPQGSRIQITSPIREV